MNSIARNISRLLNFSPNILTNDMTVTLYSNYQAVISGYKKIVVYDDSLLIVSDKKKQLKILGSNLILSEMLEDELVVKGRINMAEFETTRR